MSTLCSLINSTTKLCRIDECPAKGTFPTLSLSQLTVSLICLPHLEHVISSGKLSKNMILFRR